MSKLGKVEAIRGEKPEIDRAIVLEKNNLHMDFLQYRFCDHCLNAHGIYLLPTVADLESYFKRVPVENRKEYVFFDNLIIFNM